MKARHYPLLFLIALAGLSAYSNSFSVPFQFDDYANIVDNPTIRDLGNFFSSFDASGYNSRRLIGYLSFALNYNFGGLNTGGYHAVNIAIHIFNAVLVYFLVVLTSRTPYFQSEKLKVKSERSEDGTQKTGIGGQKGNHGRIAPAYYSLFAIHDSQLIAFFSALFFIVHPIQTQAVTYIVQRFTSLATLFYLLSLVMYIKGRLAAIGNGHEIIKVRQPAAGGSSSQEVEWSGNDSATQQLTSLASRRMILHSRFTILWFLISLLSAVLAMKTKEIAFTLPVIILLYEFCFFKSNVNKKRLLLAASAAVIIIPFLLIELGGLNLAELAQQTMVQAEGSRWVYFMTEMRVVVTYLRLIFLPVNQNIDYDYTIYDSFFSLPVFLSFLFLATIFGAAVWMMCKSQSAISGKKLVASSKKEEAVDGGSNAAGASLPTTYYSLNTIHYSRLTAFGIFWFFITLSVESGIIPIADVIFEHRVYLPSVGIFIALTCAVFALAEKFPVKFPRAVLAGMIVIAIVFAGSTWMRNRVWQSPISLWEDAAQKSPHNIRPLLSLAAIYAGAGRFEEAIGMYRKALALPPRAYLNLQTNEYPNVYNALGLLYAQLGRYDDAIAVFRMIPKIDPTFLDAYNNVGAAYVSTGRYAEAIEPLKHVTEINPGSADAHYNLSVAYLGVGDRDDAMKEYTILKQLSPELAAELYVKIAGAGKPR